MAYANKKGYNWGAGVVSSVLFGINTLGLLYVLFAGRQHGDPEGLSLS